MYMLSYNSYTMYKHHHQQQQQNQQQFNNLNNSFDLLSITGHSAVQQQCNNNIDDNNDLQLPLHYNAVQQRKLSNASRYGIDIEKVVLSTEYNDIDISSRHKHSNNSTNSNTLISINHVDTKHINNNKQPKTNNKQQQQTKIQHSPTTTSHIIQCSNNNIITDWQTTNNDDNNLLSPTRSTNRSITPTNVLRDITNQQQHSTTYTTNDKLNKQYKHQRSYSQQLKWQPIVKYTESIVLQQQTKTRPVTTTYNTITDNKSNSKQRISYSNKSSQSRSNKHKTTTIAREIKHINNNNNDNNNTTAKKVVNQKHDTVLQSTSVSLSSSSYKTTKTKHRKSSSLQLNNITNDILLKNNESKHNKTKHRNKSKLNYEPKIEIITKQINQYNNTYNMPISPTIRYRPFPRFSVIYDTCIHNNNHEHLDNDYIDCNITKTIHSDNNNKIITNSSIESEQSNDNKSNNQLTVEQLLSAAAANRQQHNNSIITPRRLEIQRTSNKITYLEID